MNREKQMWDLAIAQTSLEEVTRILDAYFSVLPLQKRVDLQLAKANLEWAIEQTTVGLPS